MAGNPGGSLVRRLRIKFTIGQIMAVIAVFAIALAVLPGGLVIFGSIILLTLVGLIVVGSAVTGAPRTQVAAWVFAGFPVVALTSVYVTWLTAWLALGHRPRPSLDDPKSIGLVVEINYMISLLLLICSVPALGLCVCFVSNEVVRFPRHKQARVASVAALAGFAVISLIYTYSMLAADPGRVFYWFMD